MDGEGTTKPGELVKAPKSALILSKLEASLQGLLNPEMMTKVPIACRLLGEQRDDLFEYTAFNEHREIFAFFENTNELQRTNFFDFRDYLSIKEPWEDYDICVFDDSFAWFVGCTHNDKIIVIGGDSLNPI